MAIINKIKVSNTDYDIVAAMEYFGTCSTAAATAAKTVSIDGFGLQTGVSVTIKFTNANSAANPTLNVAGTGAKALYLGGSALGVSWAAGQSVTCIYDGTNWQVQGDIRVVSSGTAANKPASGVNGQIYFVTD